MAETSLFVEPLRWMSGALQLGKDQVVSGKLSCPGCASLSQLFWVVKFLFTLAQCFCSAFCGQAQLPKAPDLRLRGHGGRSKNDVHRRHRHCYALPW